MSSYTDVAPTRMMLVECLVLEGYTMLSASGGREGLRLLRRLPCRAVVVLDMSMPPPDGRDILLTLSNDPAWNARFVVIVYDTGLWLELARECGVELVVEMSEGIDPLFTAVQRAQRLLAVRPGNRRFDDLTHIIIL